MKNNRKFIFLIENGLTPKTLGNMPDVQINLLYEKFKKMKKEESKEQEIIQKMIFDPTKPDQKQKLNQLLKDPAKLQGQNIEVKEDETDDVNSSNALGKDAEQAYTGQEAPHDANDMADDGMDDDSGNNRNMMGMAEGKLNEKFESKAQQGLFWARCNKCSSKNCKWCKMAKEFSDSTTKKEYKTMPEKKHPEKTVKYKKKTNEGLQKFLEKKIFEMVDSEIKPRMTKKDLVETIKKKFKNQKSMIIRRPKKVTMFSDEAPLDLPIGKMFSIGKK